MNDKHKSVIDKLLDEFVIPSTLNIQSLLEVNCAYDFLD